MTGPCPACGCYHDVTDTDPGCGYECHPECGPGYARLEDLRYSLDLRKYTGSSLRLGHSPATMKGSNKTAPAGNRGLTQSDLSGKG